MQNSDNPIDLSLVVACYNEETILAKNLGIIFEELDQTRYSYEIILVDDCSQDSTRQLIDQLIHENPDKNLKKIFHEKNAGRGKTVADGIRIARGKIAGYIDIDLEAHARYIPALMLAIRKGADIASGLRIYKFDFEAIDRYILSHGYNFIRRWMLRTNLSDTETGIKFFDRKKILPVLDEIQDQHWFWDTEIMVRSSLKGFKIQEIPILFIRRSDWRDYSTVNPFRDTIMYLKDLWRFRKFVKQELAKHEGG
ncbi:MAG: glycosyltransferase [Nitrospinales bacterium]